jgi:hypothetical protein
MAASLSASGSHSAARCGTPSNCFGLGVPQLDRRRLEAFAIWAALDANLITTIFTPELFDVVAPAPLMDFRKRAVRT